jgi:hypothetical protein
VSLTRHLTSSSAAHGRLAFHPGCPRCAAERLHGDLSGDRVRALRAQAALAAGIVAFSAAAPPTALATGPPDQEQEGSTDAGAEAPGIELDFDPGDDGEPADLDSGPELDATDDDTAPPVEIEPTSPADALTEPDSIIPPEQPPTVAPAPPVATAPDAPAPPPPQTPATLQTPQGEPEVPISDKLGQPTVPNEKHRRHQQRDQGAKTRAALPIASQPAAPVPPSEAPVAAPVASVTVSQTAPEPDVASAPESRVAGATYRVRPGDSLWSIARRLSGAEASNGQLARQVNRLWNLNNERIGTGDPDMLMVGTVLLLR